MKSIPILNLTINPGIAKQFVPSLIENDELIQAEGLIDPIGDDVHDKGGGLIHRYSSRVLLLVTDKCSIKCRHCFRKNKSNKDTFDLEKAVQYLKNNPNVIEVILSGGDPFCLSNHGIIKILDTLSTIPTIKFIRIHTRIITTNPSRIDKDIIHYLDNFKKKLSIVLHVNQTEELQNDSLEAILNIQKINIPILSQTVLLKDVNDDISKLVALFLKLVELNIRPYYLHHPDKVKGAMHFYIDIDQGIKLYNKLKQDLPGWAIPHYAIDSVDGKKRHSSAPQFI